MRSAVALPAVAVVLAVAGCAPGDNDGADPIDAIGIPRAQLLMLGDDYVGVRRTGDKVELVVARREDGGYEVTPVSSTRVAPPGNIELTVTTSTCDRASGLPLRHFIFGHSSGGADVVRLEGLDASGAINTDDSGTIFLFAIAEADAAAGAWTVRTDGSAFTANNPESFPDAAPCGAAQPAGS